LDKLAAKSPSFKPWRELEKLISETVEEFDPKCVVLTGSLASGKWIKGSSDVDLLFVTERAGSLSNPDRFRLRSINSTDINMAFFTEEEVLEGIKSLSFFFISAMDGVPLVGEAAFRRLKAIAETEFRRMRLRRTERGWTFELPSG
jgi:predicted nucleotidyltransferase